MKKNCTLCKKSKPVSEYRPNKRNPDGLNKICNQCQAEWKEKVTARKGGAKPAARQKKLKAYQVVAAQQRPQPEPEPEVVTGPAKTCRKCGRLKNLENFPRNRAYEDGRDKMCKDCWKNRDRQPVTAQQSSVKISSKYIQPTVIERVAELPAATFFKEARHVVGTGDYDYIVEAMRAAYGAVPKTVYQVNDSQRFFFEITRKEQKENNNSKENVHQSELKPKSKRRKNHA